MLYAGLDLGRKRLDFPCSMARVRLSTVVLLRLMLMDCSA